MKLTPRGRTFIVILLSISQSVFPEHTQSSKNGRALGGLPPFDDPRGPPNGTLGMQP